MKTEIKFKANGKAYTVSMSANALCLMEDAFGGDVGFHSILAALGNPEAITMTKMRKLFWSALTDHQPEITEKEAGELIVAAGGLGPTLELISRALIDGGVVAAEPAK